MIQRKSTDRGAAVGHGDPHDYMVPPLTMEERAAVLASLELAPEPPWRATMFVSAIESAIQWAVGDELVAARLPVEGTIARALRERASTIEKFRSELTLSDDFDALVATAEGEATAELLDGSIQRGELAEGEVLSALAVLSKIELLARHRANEIDAEVRLGKKHANAIIDNMIACIVDAFDFHDLDTSLPGAGYEEDAATRSPFYRVVLMAARIAQSRLEEAQRTGAPGAVQAAERFQRFHERMKPVSLVRRLRRVRADARTGSAQFGTKAARGDFDASLS